MALQVVTVCGLRAHMQACWDAARLLASAARCPLPAARFSGGQNSQLLQLLLPPLLEILRQPGIHLLMRCGGGLLLRRAAPPLQRCLGGRSGGGGFASDLRFELSSHWGGSCCLRRRWGWGWNWRQPGGAACCGDGLRVWHIAAACCSLWCLGGCLYILCIEVTAQKAESGPVVGSRQRCQGRARSAPPATPTPAAHRPRAAPPAAQQAQGAPGCIQRAT